MGGKVFYTSWSRVGGNGDVKEAKQGSVYMNGSTVLGSEDIKMHDYIWNQGQGLVNGKDVI